MTTKPTPADQQSITTASDAIQKMNKMKGNKKITESDIKWVQGFVAACAITMMNHDCPSIIEDTYACNYLSVKDLRKHNVDENDIKILLPVIKEVERKSRYRNEATRIK